MKNLKKPRKVEFGGLHGGMMYVAGGRVAPRRSGISRVIIEMGIAKKRKRSKTQQKI